MFNAVIVDAIRTPLGRRNGKLKDWHPVDLMAETMNALVERTGIDPGIIDDVVMGCVILLVFSEICFCSLYLWSCLQSHVCSIFLWFCNLFFMCVRSATNHLVGKSVEFNVRV